MADRVGQQFGNYHLIRLLGQGGFAEVYLGEHIHLGTQAAIKVLHAQLTIRDIDQFRQEARIIAHLEHPHIIRVLDFDVEGTTPFLVMSYAPNGTLKDRHPKGQQLPLQIILSYVRQVSDALEYAHNEKVIHRDIKPENMLLGMHGEVQLSDFGIALIAQSSRYESTQDIVGTMAYSAPEQIQGKPRPASDQYALGIVVYEWLSGNRPFQGTFAELVGQHLTAPPPPLHEKMPTISPDIEHVILTSLAKRPENRFVSIRAFADAFEQAIQDALPTERIQWVPPVTSLPSSSLPQLISMQSSTKKLGWKAWIGICIIALLVIGGITKIYTLQPNNAFRPTQASTSTSLPPTVIIQNTPTNLVTIRVGTTWEGRLYQCGNLQQTDGGCGVLFKITYLNGINFNGDWANDFAGHGQYPDIEYVSGTIQGNFMTFHGIGANTNNICPNCSYIATIQTNGHMEGTVNGNAKFALDILS